MLVPPTDDLPRAPSGRVPRWVVDEAAGRPTPDTAWRQAAPLGPPDPPRRTRRAHRAARRRRRWSVALLAAAAVGGVVWWAGGPGGLLGDDVPDGAVVAERPVDGPEPAPTVPPPSPEVAALADEAFMAEEGRALFYAAEPEVLGAAEFAGRCERHAGVHRAGAVGCFDGRRIVVYAPEDPRLRGSVVETAAHEMLHAAWQALDPVTRDELVPLLEDELAAVPADAPLHEQLAGSVGSTPQNRPTELFAYLGTQVWRDGGLHPRLEAVWARFVADRAALVAVHDGWRGLLDGLRAEVEAAQAALTERWAAHARREAEHRGAVATLEAYREAYEGLVAERDAKSADERARWQVAWTWSDGTDLPMAPADETIARAAELLRRDEAAVAAEAAALAEERAALDAERARVDALVADYEALDAQLTP